MSRRAVVRINKAVFTREVWVEGISRAGYEVVSDIEEPRCDDALFIWHLFPRNLQEAQRFFFAGAKVFVVENGHLGNHLGLRWVSMSLSWPNGRYPSHLGRERRSYYGLNLEPWRCDSTEVLGLGQLLYQNANYTNIDYWPKFPPRGWDHTLYRICDRVRLHPAHYRNMGEAHPVSLRDDLYNAKAVVTWCSTAALKAMVMGIPVFYGYNNWIGRHGGTHISHANFNDPQHGDRDTCFDHVFASMWTVDEIRSGMAIKAYENI